MLEVGTVDFRSAKERSSAGRRTTIFQAKSRIATSPLCASTYAVAGDEKGRQYSTVGPLSLLE